MDAGGVGAAGRERDLELVGDLRVGEADDVAVEQLLPQVTRLMTQQEWDDFQQRAWIRGNTLPQAARFIAWLVDGIPVPARILQRDEGKDELDLRLKSIR